jgi:hypothetical protein
MIEQHGDLVIVLSNFARQLFYWRAVHAGARRPA